MSFSFGMPRIKTSQCCTVTVLCTINNPRYSVFRYNILASVKTRRSSHPTLPRDGGTQLSQPHSPVLKHQLPLSLSPPTIPQSISLSHTQFLQWVLSARSSTLPPLGASAQQEAGYSGHATRNSSPSPLPIPSSPPRHTSKTTRTRTRRRRISV